MIEKTGEPAITRTKKLLSHPVEASVREKISNWVSDRVKYEEIML